MNSESWQEKQAMASSHHKPFHFSVQFQSACVSEYFTRSVTALYLHNYMLWSEEKTNLQISWVTRLQQSMFYHVCEAKSKTLYEVSWGFFTPQKIKEFSSPE